MNISILERGPRFLELAFRFLIVWSLEALETVHLQLIMLHQTTLDLEYYEHLSKFAPIRKNYFNKECVGKFIFRYV